LLGDVASAPLAGEVAARSHAPLGVVYGGKIAARGSEQALSLRSLEPDRRALWVVFIVMDGELRRLGDRVDLPAQCLDPPPGVGPQFSQGIKSGVVVHTIRLHARAKPPK
jgi:hypothetical protein